MSLGLPARLAVFAAAVASVSPLPSFADQAVSPPGGTLLTLMNGWETYRGSPKPEIFAYKGIVHLKGAIKEPTGSDNEPFIVPAPFRPAATVAVKLDLCDAENGVLIIEPDGETDIGSEDNGSDPQCFTSLDGVTYSLAATGYHALKLRKGWQHFGSDGAAVPAVRAVGNIVHFQGAMANGTSPAAFVLPAALRPQSTVWIPLDMAFSTNGRIGIHPDGTVDVQAQSDFSGAQTFTSLDGATFALDTTGFTALTLINGWSPDTADGTAIPSVRTDHGFVEFQGAMTLSSGSSDNPFVLPSGMRPAKTVCIAVDMGQAGNGRLQIAPDGTVSLLAEAGVSDPFAFVSLDGVSFHL
jgi:hypothetical protein